MRPIGQCLVDRGAITQEQLEQALEFQHGSARALSTILLDMEVISQAQLDTVLNS